MNTGEIIIYQAADGSTSLDVKLEQETIWLTQKQIAELFGTKRPAITKHLKNLFLTGELEENTTPHGAMADRTQTTEVKYCNLDAILSVGYRVNSKKCCKDNGEVFIEYLFPLHYITPRSAEVSSSDYRQTCVRL